MRRMIALDLDGILVDYYKALEKVAGKKIDLSDFDFKGQVTDREIDLAKLVACSYEPKENSQKTVNLLSQRNKVYVVTNRFYGFATSTVGWVRKNYPYLAGIMVVDEKEPFLPNFDVIIDDNPKYYSYLLHEGKTILTLEYPYNKGYGIHYAKDWFEMEEKLRKIGLI